MLTASIVLDLSRADADDPDHADRLRIARSDLESLPDDTRVIVLAGARCHDLTLSAVTELHRHARRLHLDIRGDTGGVIGRWHRAIESGRVIS